MAQTAKLFLDEFFKTISGYDCFIKSGIVEFIGRIDESKVPCSRNYMSAENYDEYVADYRDFQSYVEKKAKAVEIANNTPSESISSVLHLMEPHHLELFIESLKKDFSNQIPSGLFFSIYNKYYGKPQKNEAQKAVKTINIPEEILDSHTLSPGAIVAYCKLLQHEGYDLTLHQLGLTTTMSEEEWLSCVYELTNKGYTINRSIYNSEGEEIYNSFKLRKQNPRKGSVVSASYHLKKDGTLEAVDVEAFLIKGTITTKEGDEGFELYQEYVKQMLNSEQ